MSDCIKCGEPLLYSPEMVEKFKARKRELGMPDGDPKICVFCFMMALEGLFDDDEEQP